ncbi:hypothetical protein KJ966_28820 [bacterium]|nr:hypothetical protein [bacterium]
MGFLMKKNRRIRGAELVVTGGATMFLSNIVGWLAPVTLCIYGAYRWIFKKSYKDGITSIAVGILLMTLLKGPLGFLLWIAMLGGGLLLGIGAIMLVLPSKKDDEIEVVPTEVEDYDN